MHHQLPSTGTGCDNCFFKKKRFVGGRGDPKSPIVIIGESPGADELAKGVPFVGLSGKLMAQCLPEDFTLDDFYVTNALQCLPIKMKDTTKALANLRHATACCRNRLLEEIKAHPREIIIAMGNAAMWSLTGDTSLKITQIRGQLFESSLANRGIMATVHPAFLLRGGGHVGKFKEDVAYAIKLGLGERYKAPIPHSWVVCETPLDVYKALWDARLYRQSTGDAVIGADIETGGFNHREDEILCLGISCDPRKVYIIPEELINYTQHLFKDDGFEWVWHNGKFDLKFFRRRGLPCRLDHDTMLMSYAMNERRGFHDLEQISNDELGAPDYKHMIKLYLPKRTTSYREIPKPVLHEYAAYDVTNTKQAFTKLYRRLEKDPASSYLYHNLLIPASNLIMEIEENGIYVDQTRVEENRIYYEEKIEAEKGVINEIAHSVGLGDVNPNSPQQVAHLLYDRLKLRAKKMHGRSTAKDILEKLPEHEAVKAMLTIRKLVKSYGTYVKPLRVHVQSNGRVHASFLIHGTATGRLSCRDPNLQNIPRDPRLRGQYVASPGYILVEVDLSQAELRCLAALSNDEAMCRIYNTRGISIHKEVSVELWGEDWVERYKRGDTDPEDEIYLAAHEEYMRTKAVNFGIVYGRTAQSIAEEFEIPTRDGQYMIDGWARKFPQAWEYIGHCRMSPLRKQDLITPFGRRKRHGVVARDILHSLQNEAANFPHQSIASDITLESAIRVNPILRALGVRIVNLVHDSILFEVPIHLDVIDYVIDLTARTMKQVPIDHKITRVPFEADAKIGYRWGALQDYTPGKVDELNDANKELLGVTA